MSDYMPENPSSGYLNLVDDLETTSTKPRNPYISSFSHDFLDLLSRNRDFADRVNDSFHDREKADRARNRRPANASYAGNLALRAVHVGLFDQPGYPQTHSKPGSWTGDIEQSVLSREPSFPWIIHLFDVMSNVESRYVALQDIGSRVVQRQQHPLEIADIGSSQGHGGKIVAAGMRFQTPRALIIGRGLGKIDSRLREPIPIKRLTNIDQWDLPRDRFVQKWAKACSIPPHEMSPERIAQYDALDLLDPPTVRFAINEIGREELFKYNPELIGSVDIVHMSAVLYQMDQAKFEISLEQVRRMLTPGGIAIFSDHFGKISNKNKIVYFDRWYDSIRLPFRTMIYDSLYPEEGLVEVFRWSDGRCKEGTIPNLKALEALDRLKQPRR